MSNSSLSNILLPAVFTASTVFSILTVPFALIKSEPLVIDNILPFFSGEIQPIFDGNHKEIAIPYIGFSIVVSVGAGMATVEVIRRWNQLRES
ncbi:MAG TPA: TetR family transcriptional regulator, partial [Cyanobacteria bacterium UBA11162]|nr:TetR family transcriptional regulator [Cyanobacteria bacterium UBA11162]